MEPAGRTPGRRTPPAVVAVAVVLLAACGSGPGSDGAAAPATVAATVSSTTVQPAALRPGQPVPTATGKPVLTLTGKITRRNQAGELELDPAILDSLGVSKVEVFDPWTKKDMSFQGMWLADLLQVAGAEPAATAVHATALDDYQVDLTMADVRAGGIFLATKDGSGADIPIEDGGPTRIVFVGGVPSGASDDQWIWSLKSLDVR